MPHPKTICKNSLPTEDYISKFNEHIEFFYNDEGCTEGVVNEVVESTNSPVVPNEGVKAPQQTSQGMLFECIGHFELNNNRIEPNTNEATGTNERDQQDPNQRCTCEKCDHFIECPFWCSTNLDFKQSDPNSKKHRFLSSTIVEKEVTLECNNNIVFHGLMIPQPVSHLNDTFHHADIQNSLKRLGCSLPTCIQSYVWPAVLRSLNVFVIGPPQVGKTLAYLPAFCSVILEKDDTYPQLMHYQGPIIIILCSNVANCDQIHALATSLFSDQSRSVTVEVLSDQFKLQNSHNCDILITIPIILEKALMAGSVKIRRLCHVAIEDAHVVLRNYSNSMKRLLKVINQIQINRPFKDIQIVVSSKKWSTNVETLLKHLYVTPVVYFHDFLEAAMYAKVRFKTKKLQSTQKLVYLQDILKTSYIVNKTVVFCHENEMIHIKEYLQTSGIECIMIPNQDEIFENEDVWHASDQGDYKVLLCTDTLFEETKKVLNAAWLVHFYMPTQWSQFSKRFRSLAGNFHSPLSHEKVRPLYSFLILDEFTDQELFADFYAQYSATKHLRL